jgi:hypothetical protein
MNERIRELYNTVAGNDKLNFDSYLAEKFAELVVRECCDIFVELRTRPADLAVLDVKKHFGVES